MSPTIAVGVDGSENSLIALRWGLQTAAAGNAAVVAVIARAAAGPGGTPESAAVTGALADEHVQDVRAAVQRAAPHADVDVRVLDGTATEVMLGISAEVDLLVVGGSGYGGWREVLTPSLSGRLAVRTAAALCVVRSIPEPPRERIVVGYDGSASEAAVRFAARQADQRGATLVVVTTWHYPFDTRATSVDAGSLLEGSAAAAQADIVDEIRELFPSLRIETVVRLGQPVQMLTELADSADMVVVGSHRTGGLRHSGLARLVIGSVAVDLLRRLSLPVVVVPHD